MTTIQEIQRVTDVPAVIADHHGFITHVNQPFEEVFGWRAAEIVGQSLSAIIPQNLHDAHHLGFSRFLSTGKKTLLNRPLRLKAVTKDGRVFEAEHFIVAEQRDDQWQFGATIRPVGA